MAGGPGTGLRAGDTEKKETSLLPSRTQSSGDRQGRRWFQSSVVTADKATAGGTRAQTRGFMEELLKFKKSKTKPRTQCWWASQLVDDWNSLFFHFYWADQDGSQCDQVCGGEWHLNRPDPAQRPTLHSPCHPLKGGDSHIKKWELALTEASCLLRDNVSSVELCSACLGHHLLESRGEVASCLW